MSSIHSVIQQKVIRAYYVPETVLGSEDRALKETVIVLIPLGEVHNNNSKVNM